MKLQPTHQHTQKFYDSLLSEREADLQLSNATSSLFKWIFLFTNLPYFVAAFVIPFNFLHTTVPNDAWPEVFEPVCESSFLYVSFGLAVAISSTILHSSQMRLGHTCCSSHTARRFHDHKTQDNIDILDISCASGAVVMVLLCQGVYGIGPQMAVLIPVFFLSILAKKTRYWKVYLVSHGVWHVGTALVLIQRIVPMELIFDSSDFS